LKIIFYGQFLLLSLFSFKVKIMIPFKNDPLFLLFFKETLSLALLKKMLFGAEKSFVQSRKKFLP